MCAQGRALTFVDCGCFRPPKGAGDFGGRLAALDDGLAELLSRSRPDAVALENSFYGRDADAAAKLGEARGVLRLRLHKAGFSPALYSPAEVKKAVVGNGQATKERVQSMVARLLRMHEPPTPLDASDALAVAVCHLHRSRRPSAVEAVGVRKPEVRALLRRVANR